MTYNRRVNQDIFMSKPGPGTAFRDSDPGCQLCYSTNEETRQIISTILQSLYLLQEGQKPDDPIIDNGGFVGLLKMLFGTKYKNFKETMKCSHQRLKTDFCNALSIPQKELNELSNIKMIQKARYNYHMDVVGAQVKTFHRHFIDLTSPPKSEKVKSEEKSPVRTQKTVSPPKKLPNFSQPILGTDVVVKSEQSQNEKPKIYPGEVSYEEGIQFGNQFNQVLNNLFMMTYGIHGSPQPQ